MILALRAPDELVGYPDTPPPVSERLRANAFSTPQVRDSHLLRKSTDGLTAARLRSNSAAWWLRGRMFVCPKGCAGGEMTFYTRPSGAWCRCGTALVFAEGKEVAIAAVSPGPSSSS